MRHGHIFVSSAGNNNMGTDTSDLIHTPSGYDLQNILSVGASTESGRKTSFSNYGRKTVHVFAPGRNIISTGKGKINSSSYSVSEWPIFSFSSDGYMVNQGTSFAAPHVAGVAGLIWSKYPRLTFDQVIQAILSTCRPSRDLEKLADCGGVVNAPAAMDFAGGLANGFSVGSDCESMG